MERIKSFLRDESASAEATSTVLLIGAVSIFLGAALVAWWGPNGIRGFFDTAATAANDLGDRASTGMGQLK
jgi:hypothetical protein